MQKQTNNFPNSISKAIAVLRYFVDRQEEWGVRELAAVMGQPVSSVHRLLKILHKEGYLKLDKTLHRYRIGPEFIRVSSVIARRTRLGPTALPIMQELMRYADESVWLAVYEAERNRIFYIEEQSPSAIFPIPAPIGQEFSATADVAGWAVLASAHSQQSTHSEHMLEKEAALGVKEAKKQGYAMLVTDGRDPLVQLASAIYNATGEPIGALVISVPQHRFTRITELGLAAALMSAAGKISERMGSKILGGASTGSWHDGVQVIASLLRESIPTVSTVPSLGGGNQNLLDLQEGRGAYCITTVASTLAAYQGDRPFKRPMPELRNVMGLSNLPLHIIVRNGVQVDTLTDLLNLRVSAVLSGFSSYQMFHDLMGVAAPASRQKVRLNVVALDFAEAGRQLISNDIDCIFCLIYSEISVFKSAVENNGYLLPLDDATMDTFIEQFPGYEKTEIPKNTYTNLKKPVTTLSVGTLLATTTSRDEDEVHKVTAQIFENRDELMKASPSYSGLDRHYASRDIGLPFHDGALRYWR